MKNFSELYAFINVVQAGGFSAAARSLGVPRSSVSLQVKKLEEALGVRLLKRSTRSIALTEEGQALYARTYQQVESLSSALGELHQKSGQVRGLIRVTVPADFPGHSLARTIVQFQDEYPDVEVDVLLDNDRLDFVEEKVDIAIGISNRTDGNRVQKALAAIDWQFFASTEWLSVHGAPDSLESLSAFIAPHGRLKRFLETRVLQGEKLPAGRVSANNLLMVRELVVQSAGVGLLPAGLLQEKIDQGLVASVLESTIRHPTPLTLEFPSPSDIHPRVRKFAQRFAEQFVQERASRD